MLTGYKTKIGSIGLAFAGLARVAAAITTDVINLQEVMEGIGMIAAALAAFGIGNKLERK